MNKSPSLLEQAVHWLVSALVFLLPLVYLPYAFDIFGAPKIFLIRTAAAILALLLFALLATGRLEKPANRPLLIAVSLYLLVLIVSTALSLAPITSLFGLRRRYFGLFTYGSEYIIFLSVALVTWRLRNILMLLRLWTASATVVSLVGLAQALGSTFPFDLKQSFGNAAYSTVGNPNFVGIFLAITLPITAALATNAIALNPQRPRPRSAKQSPISLQALPAAALVTQLVGLVATKSSGAIVAGFLGLALYAILTAYSQQKLQAKHLTAMGVALSLVAVVGIVTLAGGESVSIQSRLRGWQAAVRLNAAHPVAGVGPDAMRYEMPHYLELDKRYNQEIFDDGHNLFLTTAGTTGLLGLVTFLAVLAVAGRTLLAAARRQAAETGIAISLLAGLVAYVAAETVNPDDIVPLTFFWVLLGMAGVFCGRETGVAVIASRAKQSPKVATSPAAPRDDTVNRNLWPAAALPAAGAALLLLYVAFANLGAEISLNKAEGERSFTPTVAAFRETQARFPYYDWYYVRLSDRLVGLVRQGDPIAFQTAEAAAKQAISLSPLESGNYVALGTVYRYRAIAVKDNAAFNIATDNYRKALSLNPMNLNAVRDLALAYAESGQERNARTWADRFATLMPASESVALRQEVDRFLKSPHLSR